MPNIDSRLLDADCPEKIEENFNRTLELIDENALPAVTAEDNGKVLGVADGAWVPVAAGGGGSTGSGVLSIGMTVGEEYATLDKTWQEIFNHCSAGGFAVVVFAESDLSVQTLPVSEVNSSGSGLFFVYANAIEGGAVETNSFSTESADGYPSMSIGG